MKKQAAFICLFLALFVLCAAALPAPTEQFFVNDYAGVLSDKTEADLQHKAEQLYYASGAQLVVLTVDSLEGKEPADYALQIARDWGIGDKKKSNGVLILLATDDREIRVEVGRGLEGALNDGKVGRLIDMFAVPYYTDDIFDDGTASLFDAVLSVIMKEYGIETLDGFEPVDTDEPFPWIPVIFFGGVLLIIVVYAITHPKTFWRDFALCLAVNNRRGGYRGGGFGGGGFSGGGFSGGGGGFSGGGGGFSGGGAGRSF